MDLDRGTLANLDRRLLAKFDRDEQFQMVRIPVSPAKWSMWKRYCSVAGMSMGRAILPFRALPRPTRALTHDHQTDKDTNLTIYHSRSEDAGLPTKQGSGLSPTSPTQA